MSNNRLLQVIKSQVVSEKSTRLGDKHGQYAFKVMPDATKTEVKKAVEQLFEVSVTGVRITNVKPKVTRTRQIKGKRSGWKKAYVSLAEGHSINLIEMAA